jgi:hypothetical protein
VLNSFFAWSCARGSVSRGVETAHRGDGQAMAAPFWPRRTRGTVGGATERGPPAPGPQSGWWWMCGLAILTRVILGRRLWSSVASQVSPWRRECRTSPSTSTTGVARRPPSTVFLFSLAVSALSVFCRGVFSRIDCCNAPLHTICQSKSSKYRLTAGWGSPSYRHPWCCTSADKVSNPAPATRDLRPDGCEAPVVLRFLLLSFVSGIRSRPLM